MRESDDKGVESSSPHGWIHCSADTDMINDSETVEQLSDELFVEESNFDDDETVAGLINPENLDDVNDLLVSQQREPVSFPLNSEARARIINALRRASGAGDLSVAAAHRLIREVKAISKKEDRTGRQKQVEVLELLADIYYEFR